jgi:hypothetical protein
LQLFRANKERCKAFRGLRVSSFADRKGKARTKREGRQKSAEVIEGKEVQGMKEKWQLTGVTAS